MLYGVSQLWTAYDKRDGNQWNYYLQYLSKNPRLRSKELDHAVELWNRLISESTTVRSARVHGTDQVMDWGESLFEARVQRYGGLLALTRPLSTSPQESSVTLRNKRADDLTNWYYTDSAGLLLGGDSMVAWFRLRDGLRDRTGTDDDFETMFSDLRTCLKIDLGVRHADERYVQLDI